MDPLSEVLALLKPRSYITAGFDAGGDWALRLDDLRGRIKCYAIVRGGCWLSVEGLPEPVRLRAGDCFVLPSGRVATLGSAPDAEAVSASAVLDPDRSGEVVTYNGGGDVFMVGSRFEVNARHTEQLLGTLPPLIRVATSGGQARLRWAIELMMEELREGQPGASLMAQQLAQMMLVQALRQYLAQRPPGDVSWLSALADPKLGSALAALHADPAQRWTVEGLAERAGMSRSTFAERFRACTGETPMAYLARWRMLLAAERLLIGKDPLARIASALGYESEHAFNTAFKRVMGLPPRRYAASVSAPGGMSASMAASMAASTETSMAALSPE